MDQITTNKADKFTAYKLLSHQVVNEEEVIEAFEGMLKNITNFKDFYDTVEFLTLSKFNCRLAKNYANKLSKKVGPMKGPDHSQWRSVYDLIDFKNQEVFEELGWVVFKKLVEAGTKAQLISLRQELDYYGLYRFVGEHYYDLIESQINSKSL